MEFVNTVIARQAGRREWISLAVLTIPCLLYAMDLTVLNLAVPQLSEDLQPSSTELLWIVDIYGFMAAGSLVTMGTLGDRIGRRRLLLIGAAAFGATSLLAAWSTSAAMLIAARALLGVAGATVATARRFVSARNALFSGLLRTLWELADFLCRLQYAISVLPSWPAGTLLKIVTTQPRSR